MIRRYFSALSPRALRLSGEQIIRRAILSLTFCCLMTFCALALTHPLTHYRHSQNPPPSQTTGQTTSQAPPSRPSQPNQPSQLGQSGRPAPDTAASTRTGNITGRMITDDGQPLPYAQVFAIANSLTSSMRQTTVTTDEQGRFQFTKLPVAAYSINGNVRGYFPARFIDPESGPANYYHLGDSVTLTMVKGGAITGKVTDANGEPITGLNVRALRVRASDGKQVNASLFTRERETDDRGVYRIYGLAPGSYLLTAQSKQGTGGPTPRAGQAPTYYPSATRDTAVEAMVQSGAETSGIDIRFRGDRGYAVSGTITGAPGGSPGTSLTQVSLTNVVTQASEGYATVISSGDKQAFALYSVPEGEYEITASRSTTINEDAVIALPRRVSVKGADVTGLELTLVSLGSISGRVALEASSVEPRPGCEIQRPSYLQEVVVKVRRAEKERRDEAEYLPWVTANATPDSQGAFTLRSLKSALYRVETNLPGEHWYVKSITAPHPASSRQTLDLGRGGLTLKLGEKAKDLVVTIAEGAASVRGRVTPATEGAKLPARLRVHLIPAEREAADDVLRYAQTTMRSDGSFNLLNLVPGKYWLLARALMDDELSDGTERPMVWDNAERAKLRREAETGKIEIELQPCQRVNDYALRYAAAKSK